MRSNDPFSDWIKSESEKKEAQSPAKLKEELDRQKNTNLVLQVQLGNLRKEVEFLTNQYTPSILQSAGLREHTKTIKSQASEIATLKVRLQEDAVNLGKLTSELENLKVREEALTESVSSQVEVASMELMARLDAFEKRVFGLSTPKIGEPVPLKKSQGGFTFDYANYGTLGPIQPLSKFMERISDQDYVMSAYPDEVGASTLMRIHWNDLSIRQQLLFFVAKTGMLDQNKLITDAPDAMLSPDRPALSKFNQSLADKKDQTT